VKEIRGDLFQAARRPGILLAHGCNMQGFMGAGIAKGVKNFWYPAFKMYQEALSQGNFALGDVIFADMGDIVIANLLTQRKTGPDASYDAIEKAVKNVESWSKTRPDITHYIAPRIGCGIGGLNWEDVRTVFESSSLNWEIYFV
jgi:O-acetyl-ADP-ribose deacetylase (regulator of RNase III)